MTRPFNVADSLRDRVLAEKPARITRIIGRSGYGLYEFIESILADNELVPAGKRLTDEMILAAILAEFALHKRTTDQFTQHRVTVNTYREKYNTGVLFRRDPKKPARVSFRYNSEGKAVRTRQPTVLLSREEMLALVKKYGIADPRFQGKK